MLDKTELPKCYGLNLFEALTPGTCECLTLSKPEGGQACFLLSVGSAESHAVYHGVSLCSANLPPLAFFAPRFLCPRKVTCKDNQGLALTPVPPEKLGFALSGIWVLPVEDNLTPFAI